jgi:hypothetical protein
MQETLSQLASQRQPICYYPSFGWDWQTLGSIPERHFVVSDFTRHHQLYEQARAVGAELQHDDDAGAVFRTRDGRTIVYVQDENTNALHRLRDLGIRISTLIGKTDGCHEGGNYECVNDVWFLRDVMATAELPLRYYTNHLIRGIHCTEDSTLSSHRYCEEIDLGPWRDPSHPAEQQDPNDLRQSWFLGSRRFSIRRKSAPALSHPRPMLTCFEVTDKMPQIRAAWFGDLEVSIERENIASALLDVDGVFGSARLQQQRAFLGYAPDSTVVLEDLTRRSAQDLTAEILRAAEARNWNSIATMPFGNGDHAGLIKEVSAHKGQGTVNRLRLLHLDRDDYRDIRPLFRSINDRSRPNPSPPRYVAERRRVMRHEPAGLS